LTLSSDAKWFKYYGKTPHSIDYPDISMFEMVKRTSQKYGSLIAYDFMGKAVCEDSRYPEEWIASAVQALNRDSKKEKEGVSKLQDSAVYLDEFLAQNPYEALGPTGKLRILVKFLDSAIRLPAQAHPDVLQPQLRRKRTAIPQLLS
jgi:mannose-6-phosphate isomerase class I